MKMIALIVTACAVLTAAAFAGEHPTKTAPAAQAAHPMKSASGWFDFQNCQFCQNLVVDPELLPHMTWESHNIEGGMIQIATVDAAHAASYAKCSQAIEKLGTEMMNGTVNPMTVKMCGSCTAFGQLMMAGVKMENVDGEAADVTVITSSDPALVAKVHEYCDRNNKEMALMMGDAHSGHGH